MRIKITLLIGALVGAAIIYSCSKTNDDTATENLEKSVASGMSKKGGKLSVNYKKKPYPARRKFVDSERKFRELFQQNLKAHIKEETNGVRMLAPEPTETTFYNYYVDYNNIVGDLTNEIVADDGPQIYAVSQADEDAARAALQEAISDAKAYLFSSGLDFSDVWIADDPRYIHAAHVQMEFEDAAYLYDSNLLLQSRASLQHCIFEAIGINQLLQSGIRYLSKQIIIETVAKIAMRNLGFIGAAWAIGEFAACYWGD